MLPYQDRKRVMLWLQEAFLKAEEESLLSPDLINQMRSSLTLKWSDKMNRCMGMARYNPESKEAAIRLSTILWEAAGEANKKETVFHEFAHIVVDIARGAQGAPSGNGRSIHGAEWRLVMQKLGYPNADRCHNVVNEEYERSQGKVPLHCACQSKPVAWVSFRRALHYLDGTRWCRRCRHPLYSNLQLRQTA